MNERPKGAIPPNGGNRPNGEAPPPHSHSCLKREAGRRQAAQ
jgi:hypothetical protein